MEGVMGLPADAVSNHLLGRRDALRYGAFASTAAIVGSSVGIADQAHAHERDRTLPAPKPIPGGFAPDFHVFVPGPPDVTLPFTGAQLMGLDVEPAVFTDYCGFTALAYHAGTATGSDGNRYDLETDMRAYRGRYVASDGTTHRGAFGFV
jgi:hypothetical protein